VSHPIGQRQAGVVLDGGRRTSVRVARVRHCCSARRRSYETRADRALQRLPAESALKAS